MTTLQIFAAIAIGLGATFTIDIWALFLRRAFDVPSLNYCLLGRWVLHFPSGRIAHPSIAAAQDKPHECGVGWTTHYVIGVTFAFAFVGLVSVEWLARPTLLPALVFGIATVLVPFLTLQPAIGLGIASSRTAHPNSARLKSLTTHAVFGLGLWAWAVVVSRIFGSQA